MYEIPEKEAFDLMRYYSSNSDTTKVIHNSWPIFTSFAATEAVEELIKLLETSLSLDVTEKLKVLNSSNLSEFQVIKLIATFKDEQMEFNKLMPNAECVNDFETLTMRI